MKYEFNIKLDEMHLRNELYFGMFMESWILQASSKVSETQWASR